MKVKIILMVLLLATSLAAFLHLTAMAQIPEQVPNWPFTLPTNGLLNHRATIRFGSDFGEQHLYWNTVSGEVDKFNMDGAFFPGWPVIIDTLYFRDNPAVVDIDHDGIDEVVTGGYRVHNAYDLIYAIDDDGSIMPGWPVRLRYPSLNVADLDNDNEYEIICYSEVDSIFCFDHAGNPKPGWPIPFHLPGVESWGGPGRGAIGDLDLDGTNEFILGWIWNIYAFRHDGSMMPGFPIHLEDTTYVFYNGVEPPALADIDGDGYLEILTAGDNWSVDNPENFTGFVAVYDHQGNMESGWPMIFPNQIIWSAVTPADIDGDNTLEIGFKTNAMYFVHSNGELLPGWPSQNVASNNDLIIVDLDGDRDCEIFTDYNILHHDDQGPYGLLFALDHLGQFLPDYPIRTRGSYLQLPPTFALNETNHRLYMGLADHTSEYHYLELFQFPDSTGPPDQWPMNSHDNLSTRNYNFVDRVTSINDEGQEILPRNIILKQNYPNPFNFSTIIEFVLPREEHVTLSLYDILGRKIKDLVNGEVSAGAHAQRVALSNLSSGVYYYVLQTPTTRVSRKMVLLK